MKGIFRHPKRTTIGARLVGFLSWYALVFGVLLGLELIMGSGHVLMGALSALAGIALFILLGRLADRVEKRFGGNADIGNRDIVPAEESPVNTAAPQREPQPEPEQPPEPQPEEAQPTENQPEAAKSGDKQPAGAPPEKKPLDIQARKRILVLRCMEHLAEMMPEKLGEKGFGEKYNVGFDIPGTSNVAFICGESDELDENLRRVVTRAIRSGYDLCVSHYMAKGTLEEMIAYLRDEANAEELLTSINSLSESVDDKF